MFTAHTWLFTRELLVMELRGPYRMLGIEPRLVMCQARSLPAVFSLLVPEGLPSSAQNSFSQYMQPMGSVR